MDGEALNRKYHELLGRVYQSYGNGGGFWHMPGCKLPKRGPSECGCAGHWELPKLHLDGGLAVNALDATGKHWSMSVVEDDPDCAVKGRHVNVLLETVEFEKWPDVCGETVCIAILRALIAALEVRDEG